MRSTDPYAKDMPFKQRHEHTMDWNMPLSIGWIFRRVWFIDSEEYVAEYLYIDVDLIDKFLAEENMDPSTDVADEADVVVLNAFAAQIDSNAQEFMSPHQVACLTALILASCQDAPDRVSTLETAKNELLLWQQEGEPAARTSSESSARGAGGRPPLPLESGGVSAKLIFTPVPPLKSLEKLLTRISRMSMLRCLIVLRR